MPEDIDDMDLGNDEAGMWHECPNCGHAYDEIDFEYQICHFCKFEAVNKI